LETDEDMEVEFLNLDELPDVEPPLGSLLCTARRSIGALIPIYTRDLDGWRVSSEAPPGLKQATDVLFPNAEVESWEQILRNYKVVGRSGVIDPDLAAVILTPEEYVALLAFNGVAGTLDDHRFL
jgi:hypothetical protein